MKAEELSVGDYVYANGMEIHKIVSIITNNEGNPIIDTIGVYNYGSAYIDNIKPIPITPEILEKNGFKSNVECYDKIGWDWGDEFIYAFVFKHDSGRFVVDCGGKCEGHYVGFIDSVHELQHALRLCNINKEITL